MMFNPYVGGLVVWVLSMIPASAAATQDAAKAPAADQPDATEMAPTPALPTLPNVRLAPLPGFDDDASYTMSIADRVAQLATQADVVDDPARRADYLLAAANQILAYQLEPTCTRRLLRLDAGKNGLDDNAIRTALDRALGFTIRAGEIADDLQDRDALPDGWIEELRHRLDIVNAFAAALREYFLPKVGDDADAAGPRAASRLAPLLEDRDRRVAAAATFWQACLRSGEDDAKPALSVLALALADLPRESMPYGFFARLLRCRLVAEHESPAAAGALLLQIEERAREWLSTEEEKLSAAHAAQLVRIQILADWHGHLDGPSHAAERKWCVDRVEQLVSTASPENANTVLRLSPAIPIVAAAPGQGATQDNAHSEQDNSSDLEEHEE